MKMTRIAILGLAGLILAGASAGAWAQSAPVLKVYAVGEITPDRYTVMRRLWVEDWRSAFWVSRHDESAAAITALVDAAGRAGADGVVNLSCTRDPGGILEPSGFYCYGLAIKLK